MNPPKANPDEWGQGGISEEINSQISAMPDRPGLLLVIITINKTPEEARFREMGPVIDHFISDLPYDMYGFKVRASLFGFESESIDAFAKAVLALSKMNIDEAILYISGNPTLRISKLILRSRPAIDTE
jgi:hypothetical protein